MKRSAVTALLFCLALGLCACRTAEPSSLPEPPPESISGEASPRQTILPDPAYAEEPPGEAAPADILPPELVRGLSREEADFLTPEQWAVYDEGVTRSWVFLLSPGIFSERDYDDAHSALIQENGCSYRRYGGMDYSGFTDFHRDMRTVYTEELFQRLNTFPGLSGISPDDGPPIYRDFNGKLYHLDFDGGANPMVIHSLTRFQLTSRTEERVEFDQIAYFSTREDVDGESRTAVGLCHCPVALVKEPDGWKMAEYTPIYRASPEEEAPPEP